MLWSFKYRYTHISNFHDNSIDNFYLNMKVEYANSYIFFTKKKKKDFLQRQKPTRTQENGKGIDSTTTLQKLEADEWVVIDSGAELAKTSAQIKENPSIN